MSRNAQPLKAWKATEKNGGVSALRGRGGRSGSASSRSRRSVFVLDFSSPCPQLCWILSRPDGGGARGDVPAQGHFIQGPACLGLPLSTASYKRDKNAINNNKDAGKPKGSQEEGKGFNPDFCRGAFPISKAQLAACSAPSGVEFEDFRPPQGEEEEGEGIFVTPGRAHLMEVQLLHLLLEYDLQGKALGSGQSLCCEHSQEKAPQKDPIECPSRTGNPPVELETPPVNPAQPGSTRGPHPCTGTGGRERWDR